jgi:hypothetical protein
MSGPHDAGTEIMWSDLDTHQFTHHPEDDPTLSRYLVFVMMLAAVASTLVGMYVSTRAPMYGI